jgi:transcriptional regulator with XRE-family HTH domain
MAEPVGTAPRRQLARQLRMLRERSGLTLEAAAARLEFSTSKLSRIENGQQVVDVHWVRSMLDLYDAGTCWEQLLDLARQARQPGWWRAYGLNDRGYVPLEAGASLVREFTITVVPGLLQTADYARALFRSATRSLDAAQIEREVEVRMIRQRRLLAEDNPLRLEAIVDEAVLHRPVGGRTVLRTQLDHLIIAAELDTVTLRVLLTEKGEHPGLDGGGFTVLTFAERSEPDLAYIEHVGGAVHIEKADEVARCTLAFDHLRSAALSPADSVSLLERATART